MLNPATFHDLFALLNMLLLSFLDDLPELI
jgi:hypothetical protein